MTAPSRTPDDYRWVAARSETFARLRQALCPELAYRSKDDVEPVLPLPQWTSWALMAWTLGTAALYTAILSRCWE